MRKKYNLKQIRDTLTEGFSAEELREFCFYNQEFKEVYRHLPANCGAKEIVQKIIEFAEQRELFEHLLKLIREENPTIYGKYFPLQGEISGDGKVSDEDSRRRLFDTVDLLAERIKELQNLIKELQDLRNNDSDSNFRDQIDDQEQKVRGLQSELKIAMMNPLEEETLFSLREIKRLEKEFLQLQNRQAELRRVIIQPKPSRFSQDSQNRSFVLAIIFIIIIIFIGTATFFVLNTRIPTDGPATPGANIESTSTASVPTVEVSSTSTSKLTSTPILVPSFTPTEETLPTITLAPTILLPPEEPSLTPEAFTVTPTAPPIITPSPSPTESPAFTPTSPATATPVPEPIATKPVEVGPGVVENFASPDSCVWTRGDQKFGDLTCSNFEGQPVGKLVYDFSKASDSDSFVVFKKKYHLTGNVLFAKVYGDNSGNYLNAWVEDDDGEVWQIPFGKINFTKWQTMTADFRVTGEWPYGLISGSNDNKLDHPIRLNALVLDYIPNNPLPPVKGEIYIGNLTSGEEQPSSPSPAPIPQPLPTPPKPTTFTGRIAFPMDDGSGNYNVWVRNLSTGEEALAVSRARQPNFYKKDGRLLVNGENNEKGNNILLVDSNFNFVDMISEFPEDEHPFWDTGGSRLVHGNPVAIGGLPHLFVHCSLKRPQFEDDPQCQDVITYGVLGVSGPGDTWGGNSVWLPDNRIAFQGLGDMAPYNGIYLIDSSAALKYRGQKYNLPERPLLVPQTTSNSRPTDAWSDRLFFFADDIDGNWEVYSIKLDGSDRINLSNSPNSSDGLPTVSPDGQWAAFVSDRSGSWGIWVVPSAGGTPEKLFDFPRINPWGVGPHDWTTERISWGP